MVKRLVTDSGRFGLLISRNSRYDFPLGIWRRGHNGDVASAGIEANTICKCYIVSVQIRIIVFSAQRVCKACQYNKSEDCGYGITLKCDQREITARFAGDLTYRKLTQPWLKIQPSNCPLLLKFDLSATVAAELG